MDVYYAEKKEHETVIMYPYQIQIQQGGMLQT